MKYCWKSNNYTAGLRHSTIQKDTGLSRTTIHRTLLILTKLNVISTIKGRSGKTYQINPKFVKFEKGMFQNETSMYKNETFEEKIKTFGFYCLFWAAAGFSILARLDSLFFMAPLGLYYMWHCRDKICWSLWFSSLGLLFIFYG